MLLKQELQNAFMPPVNHMGRAGAVHSMTGSQTLLSLLHRLGHTVSCSTWERVESAVAECLIESHNQGEMIKPPDIKPAFKVDGARKAELVIQVTVMVFKLLF